MSQPLNIPIVLRHTVNFCSKYRHFVVSFILFSKGTPQDYRSDGGEFANDWFHFSFDEKEKALFEALEIPFDKVINIGDISNLSQLIKSMSFENYSANLYKTDSVELYLQLFFIKLSEKLHSTEQIRISSCYDKMSILRAKIYSMPQNDWNVEGLAGNPGAYPY